MNIKVLLTALLLLLTYNSMARKGDDCKTCKEKDEKGFLVGENVHFVYYDFKHKVFYKKTGENCDKEIVNLLTMRPRLRPNDQLQIKIENINRYLYNVSVQGTNVDYHSEMPSLLRELLIGEDTARGAYLASILNTVTKVENAPAVNGGAAQKKADAKAVENLSGEAAKMGPVPLATKMMTNIKTRLNTVSEQTQQTTEFNDAKSAQDGEALRNALAALLDRLKQEQEKQDTVKVAFEHFKNVLRAFNENYNTLKAKRISAYYLCNNFDGCGVNTPAVTDGLVGMLNSLGDVRLALADLQFALNKGRDEKTAALAAAKAELKKCTDQNEKINLLDTKVKTELAELNRLKKENPVDEKKVAEQQKKLDAAKEELTKAGAKCDNAAELEGKLTEFSNTIEFYKSIDNLQSALPTETELSKVYLFVKNIREQNNSYTTPPLYATGNRFEIAMTMRSWDTAVGAIWHTSPYDNDSLYISMPVLGRPFVSFSSGTFIGIDRFMQQTSYTWQQLPNGSNVIDGSGNYVLVPNGYTELPIGFAAFINAEKKWNDNWGFGPSVGVGLTLDARVAYLGGLSLYFGEWRQIALTAGFAGMNVKKLTPDMRSIADQGIQYTNSAKPTISYYNDFKIGTFVSISYTPFTAYNRPVHRAARRERNKNND